MSWLNDHSRIEDHEAAWREAQRDLGIEDILDCTPEQFSEALRLATRILYFEKGRRKEGE